MSAVLVSTTLPSSLNVTLSLNLSDPPVSSSVSGAVGPSMTHRFLVESVLGMLLGIFGILGNLLALIVLFRQKPRVTTNVVLMVLAIMDNCVLLSAILLRSLRYLPIYTGTMRSYLDIYPHLFIMLYPWVYIFRLLDMWLTVLLTVDRYIVVCRPLHANTVCTTKRAVRDIVIIALFSVLFSIPRFFEYKLDSTNEHGFKASPLTSRRTYTVVYRIVAFFLVQYVVPLMLLVALNVLLLASLRRASVKRAIYQRQSVKSKASSCSSSTRSVTKIVVIVVLICVLANSLALIAHLLWSLEMCWPSLQTTLASYRRYVTLYSNITVSINSASNLPIYYLCSKRFRDTIRDTFINLCRRGGLKNSWSDPRRVSQSMYMSETRTTCRFKTQYTSVDLSPTNTMAMSQH